MTIYPPIRAARTRKVRLPRQGRSARPAPMPTGRLTGRLRLGRPWTGCVMLRPVMTVTCPHSKYRNR